MLPRYQGQTTREVADNQQQRGGGRSRQQTKDGHDYLKWTDLSTDPKTAKILACRAQPDNFNKSQILVMTKISLDGQIRLYPLRLNNPNLEVLQNAFSSDENEWVDQKILLSTAEDDVTGQHQIVVEVPEKEKTKAAKR